MKQSEAYLIKDTHLRLGSKIHISHYVFAKRLFQKSFYASKFAFLLANKILKEIENKIINKSNPSFTLNNNELVLIGYAYYSELLVSRIKSIINQLLLIKGDRLKISHIIIDNENDINLNFYFRRILPNHCEKIKFYVQEEKPEPKKYFCVITPISSTLTTAIKIENEFHRQIVNFCKRNCSARKNGECQIYKDTNTAKKITVESKHKELCERSNLTNLIDFESIPFQTVVVVGNGILNMENYKSPESTKLTSLGFWNEIFYADTVENKFGRQIVNLQKGKNNAPRINQFSIYIESKWENIDSCIKCFPDKATEESPLFFADKTLVAPDFIYSMPDVEFQSENSFHDPDPFFVFGSFENDSKLLEKKVTDINISKVRPLITIDMIKNGHFPGTFKHFYNYFDYARFFEINENRILLWAHKLREELYGLNERNQYGQEISKESHPTSQYISQNDKILLITPNKSSSGTFAFMINRHVFNERCNIISFNPFDENITDFKLFFENWLTSHKPNKTLVYYVDNLLTKGNTALKVHDIIKFVRKSNGSVHSEGLAGTFTMISRLESFDFFNLERKFQITYGKASFVGTFAFARVNHPVIETQIAKIDENNCYLCNDLTKYRKIAQSCTLDTTRAYFNFSNIPKLTIKSKHDEGLRLKPSTDLNKYLRLIVTHELYKIFYKQNDSKLKNHFIDEESEMIVFIDKMTTNLLKNLMIDDTQKQSVTIIKNEIKLKIIKVLAEQPFVSHRNIKRTVFRWIIKELDGTLKEFIEKILGKYVVDDSFLFQLNYIRMLFKKAAQLNANYIIREEQLNILFILAAHEENIYNSIKKYESVNNPTNSQLAKLENFRIFIVAAIKESLFNNEPKAIKLEQNLTKAFIQFNKWHKENNIKLSTEPVLRLFESIMLENAGVIRQAYNSWDRYYPDFEIKVRPDDPSSSLLEIIDNINAITEDTKINNLKKFIFNHVPIDNEFVFNINNESKYFIFSLLSYTLMGHYSKKSSISESEHKEDDLKGKVNNILALLCKILDIDEKNGGAFLLVRYQNIAQTEIMDDDLVVFGKVGKGERIIEYLSNHPKSLSKEMIMGIPFLNNYEGNKYFWTGIGAFKNGKTWRLQDYERSFLKYGESSFSDTSSYAGNMPTRYFFFRICNWANENYSEAETKAIPQAVIVFYDNTTNDEQNAIEFDITKTRLVLGLKNEISRFVELNLANDSFKKMVESERIRLVYENRFNKFTHEARVYLEDWLMEMKSSTIQLDKVFALGQVVNSHIEMGYSYSNYLSKMENFYSNKSLMTTLSDKQINELTSILSNLRKYFRDKNPDFKLYYNQLNAGIVIPINYDDLKHIILELICNAINKSSKNTIRIICSKEYLVIKSFGREINHKTRDRIIRHISGDYPKYSEYGIGLFIINKIFMKSLNKQIELKVRRNCLLVSLPLK
jgi:hypothetical protein